MLTRDFKALRTIFLAITTLLAPLTVAAQVSPAEMSVDTHDPIRPMIRIMNMHRLPMTAYLVTVDLTRSHRRLSRLYFDIYAHNYGRSESILGGASTEMLLPHWVGEPLPTAVLRAAIFEDGTTWGDTPWVTEILEMRKILWLRTAEASTVLRSIEHLPADRSANTLRRARQFRAEAVVGAPVEKRLMHDWPFSMAMRNLDENSLWYDKPAERSVVLQHLIKYLDDWRASLEAAKPSIATWSPSSPSAVDLESRLASIPPRASKARLVPASFSPSRARSPQPTLPTCTTVNTEPVAAGGNDASKVTAVSGVCGNQTWELIAEFSSQTFDKGSQEAFGVCTGGFQDCAGFPVPQGKVIAEVHMFNVPSAPAKTIGFGWSVDSWLDVNGSCTNCPNPSPQGQTQAQADHSFPISPFFVDCQ